ncbi:unnamed protein product [Oikopleura dioica]|uniref:Non-specific serine/threonine protein kinase n=1 Tax=Oikopleura dioica TaxID=34765 RepID=E4Y141_OIKDI|nr:unnamed protein product [Oikopleura dioica]
MVVEKTLLGFPKELQKFVTYCRALKFEEQPDYMYLRNLLRGLARQWKIEFDGIYCWNRRNKLSVN